MCLSKGAALQLRRRYSGAKKSGTPIKRSRQVPRQKSILLYHDMRVHESFEQCATRLYEIARTAEANSPSAPRILFLDIQAHRNSASGFDRDALEILQNFMLPFFMLIH
jgi:hypothetical protein